MINFVLFTGMATGFTFGCERLGRLFLERMFRDEPVEWIEAWGMGAALLTLILIGFALFGLYGTAAMMVLLGGLFVLGLMGARAISWGQFTRISSAEKDLNLLSLRICLLVLLGVFFGTVLTPETRHDPYDYHLTIPTIYLAEGQAVEIPWHVFSYMPKNGEILYGFALGLGNDSFAKLIHYLFGGAILLLVYTFMRRVRSHEAGMLGAFLVCSLPLYGYLATSAYIDLIRAFWELFALYWLYRAWERGDPSMRCWMMMLSATMAGMALGTKYVSWGVFALPYVVVYAWLAWRSGFQRFFLLGICGGILFWVPVSPWLVLNAWWTGNPVYPLLPDLFGMHIPPAPEAYEFFRGHAPPVERIVSLEVFPFILERVQSLLIDGNALVMLGGVALLASAWWQSQPAPRSLPRGLYYGLLVYLLLSSVLFIYLTDNHDGRFFVSVLFLLSIPVTYFFLHIGQFMQRFSDLHPFFVPAMVLIVFINAVTYRYGQLIDLEETVVPLWSEAARDAHLLNHFEHYPLVRWANDSLPDDAFVLCAGYPLRRNHVSRIKFGYWPVLHDLENPEAEILAVRLRDAGVTHVVSPFTNLSEHIDFNTLLPDYLDEEFRHRSYVLYALKDSEDDRQTVDP